VIVVGSAFAPESTRDSTAGLRVAAAPERPNIILFLVDDLGWQDTSQPFHLERTPFNDRYRTPHIERLARQGMMFTNAYAASPVCTPTRTSIMTGRNPARTHITNWTLRNDRDEQETGPPDYPLRSPEWDFDGLQPSDTTLPAILRAHGYRTIHVGKAHFGALETSGADPTNLGFDVNVAGHAAGGPGSYYGLHNFGAAQRGGAAVWDVPGLEKYHGRNVNLTESLTQEAIRFIGEAVEEGRPFFLNMAHYGVHAPIMADSGFVENYPELDVVEAAYSSMIEAVDASLGEILQELDRLEISENTLVVFTSDNGGLSAHARGMSPSGTRFNSHNLPLRSGKGSAYEGGTRVPMVVAWARRAEGTVGEPSVMPGSSTDVPVVSHDLFPTILAAAGVTVPADYALDGHDLVPLLSGGEGFRADRLLVWHYPHKWGPEGPGLDPFTSIRDGPWKLIYFYHDRRWELYDLSRDLGETINLVRARPGEAARLARKMIRWMQDVDAQVPHERFTDIPVDPPALTIPE
jgi:arylsulfatase A-like enzyme